MDDDFDPEGLPPLTPQDGNAWVQDSLGCLGCSGIGLLVLLVILEVVGQVLFPWR